MPQTVTRKIYDLARREKEVRAAVDAIGARMESLISAQIAKREIARRAPAAA